MRDYGEELLSSSPPPATQGQQGKPKRDYGDELLSAKLNTTVVNPTSPRRQAFLREEPFTDNPAGPVTAAGSGTIENPESKMRFFARQRFPDLPEAEAMSRYGMHNGDIVFVDDDGRVQKEVAGIGATTGEFMGETALPVAGAIVGTMAGGPVGGGLGGAGGLAWRKNIGRGLGDRQTAGGNVWDLAKEGLLNWGFAKGGEKFAEKVVNRRVAKDAVRFDRQLTTQIIEKGKQFGIDVTPAEASGLASLISQQTRMGKGFDDAGDIIGSFYRDRAKQEAKAVDDIIGATPSGAKAGADVRNVAGNTIEGAKAARRAEAGPLYRQHVDNYELPPEIVTEFTNDPLLMQFAERVKKDPVYGMTGDESMTSLRFWDTVKKTLDSSGTQSSRAGANFEAGQYSSAAKKITSIVDDINPGYAEARAAFAGRSPEVNAFVEGLEGVLAGTKDTGLARSARSLFSSQDIDPQDVARIRGQFLDQGKDKEWNETLNYWLRHQWETIKKGKGDPDGINVAGDWRKRVFGSERQKKVMQVAMGPQRFKAFVDLMDVLEATSRVPKAQSMTQPAAEAARQEAFDAAPVASLSKGLGVTGIRDWWIASKTDAWRTDIAKVITNQDSLETLAQLRKLRSMNPKSEKAIELVGIALAQSGVYGGNKVLSTPPSRMPQVLEQ